MSTKRAAEALRNLQMSEMSEEGHRSESCREPGRICIVLIGGAPFEGNHLPVYLEGSSDRFLRINPKSTFYSITLGPSPTSGMMESKQIGPVRVELLQKRFKQSGTCQIRDPPHVILRSTSSEHRAYTYKNKANGKTNGNTHRARGDRSVDSLVSNRFSTILGQVATTFAGVCSKGT